jgi:hypothetical protein
LVIYEWLKLYSFLFDLSKPSVCKERGTFMFLSAIYAKIDVMSQSETAEKVALSLIVKGGILKNQNM